MAEGSNAGTSHSSRCRNIIHLPFSTTLESDASTTGEFLTDVELSFPEILLATSVKGVERDGVMALPTADGVFVRPPSCEVFDNTNDDVRSV